MCGFLFDEQYQEELRKKLQRLAERDALYAKQLTAAISADNPDGLIFLVKSLPGDVDPFIRDVARDALRYRIQKIQKDIENFEIVKTGQPKVPTFFKSFGAVTTKPVSIALLKARQEGENWYLTGIASDNTVDRDGDRMSPRALTSMRLALSRGIPVFVDHQHTMDSMIGRTTKCEEIEGQLQTEILLEDPRYNSKVASILSKVQSGQLLGLSIGGDMLGDGIRLQEEGVSFREIPDVNLYELSVVGLPSNANATVTGIGRR